MQNKNQLRTQNAKENLGRQAKEISSQHVNFWAELEEKVGYLCCQAYTVIDLNVEVYA